MNLELINAIKAIEKERMIPAESLFEAIEGALVAAYKREFTDLKNYTNIQAEVDRETGEMTVYLLKEVVEEVMDPNAEISLEEAKVNSSDVELGDMLAFETNPDKLGRLAAQSAKAVIMQKLADAEKQEFKVNLPAASVSWPQVWCSARINAKWSLTSAARKPFWLPTNKSEMKATISTSA